MIYEYAIEPEIVATWGELQNYRFFKDKMGIGTTRIVARFPKKWKKMVYDAFVEIKKKAPNDEKKQAELQSQEQRLVAIIQAITENQVKRPAQAHSSGKWNKIAITEYNNRKFHAVICSDNHEALKFVISAKDLNTGEHHLWLNDVEKEVPSKAITLGMELAPLLNISKEIKIIDPYFRANRQKWTNVFREIIKHVASGMHQPENVKIEVIASLGVQNCPEANHYKNECLQYIRHILPHRLKVTFRRWEKKNNGEKLHHRYLLTEFGGIKLDPGFDEDWAGGTHTEFTVLGRERYMSRWKQYASDTSEFNTEKEVFFVVERQ